MGQPFPRSFKEGTVLSLVVPKRLLEACGVAASACHGRIVPAASAPPLQPLALLLCLSLSPPRLAPPPPSVRDTIRRLGNYMECSRIRLQRNLPGGTLDYQAMQAYETLGCKK
mgnify:CR=1 FL=1